MKTPERKIVQWVTSIATRLVEVVEGLLAVREEVRRLG